MIRYWGRQFFAHYLSVECKVERKSESDKHLAMKHALKERIDEVSFSMILRRTQSLLLSNGWPWR